MRTAADSVSLASLVPVADQFDLLMGYDDGAWPDAAAIAAAYPGKTVVRITTDPHDNEGDMLDVESGDARPSDAPAWTARRRASGHRGPLTYFPESWRQQVLDAYAAAGVHLPGLFPAAYPGPGAVLIDPATDVGHQYADVGPYDESIVVDYLPGIDPAPLGATMPTSPVVETKPNQVDTFQISGGTLWHKWFIGGKWSNEPVAGPAGGVSGKTVTLVNAVPQVSVEVGQVFVTAEDTSGREWVFNQPLTSTSWVGGALP